MDGGTKAPVTASLLHGNLLNLKADVHQTEQEATPVHPNASTESTGVDTWAETDQDPVPTSSHVPSPKMNIMNHGSGVTKSGIKDFSQESWYHNSSDYGNRRSRTGGSSQSSRKQYYRAHRQRNVRHERMEATPLVSVSHQSRTENPEDEDSSQEDDYQSDHYEVENAEIDRRLSSRLWELLGMHCSDVASSHHAKPPCSAEVPRRTSNPTSNSERDPSSHRFAEVPRRTSNSERDPPSQYPRDTLSQGNPSRNTRSGAYRVGFQSHDTVSQNGSSRLPERRQTRIRQSAEFAGPPPVRRSSPSVPTDYDYQDSRPPLSTSSPVDHRSTYVRSPADYSRSAERTYSRPATLPRTITFNGSGSWQAFFTKFTSFADEYDWNSRQRQTQLCWCLDGKASEYYASLLEREPSLGYSGIIHKLQTRFGPCELPEVSQMRFTYARQRTDATQTEWADRLLTLAMQAFPGLPEEHLQRQVILRFCQGSNSREAAQFAINSQPKTLDEALYRVRLFHCTQRTVYGKVRKDVKHLSVETDMIHPEVEVCKVGAVSNPLRPTSNPQRSTSIPLRPTSNPQRSTSIPQRPTSSSQRPSVSNLQCSPTSNTSSATDRLDRLESRMSTLENKVDSMHSLLLTISDSVITRSSPNRFRSPGRASPSRTNTCFKCGQIGHFRKDCPDIKKSGKTVSFVSDDEGNHYGSEEEAESRSE